MCKSSQEPPPKASLLQRRKRVRVNHEARSKKNILQEKRTPKQPSERTNAKDQPDFVEELGSYVRQPPGKTHDVRVRKRKRESFQD